MTPTEDSETRQAAAARIRAARGYAGMSQSALANALEISLATFKRIETCERPVTMDELLSIGKACNVPPEFMIRGFDVVIASRKAILNADYQDMPSACAERFSAIDSRLNGFEDTARRIDGYMARLFADSGEVA